MTEVVLDASVVVKWILPGRVGEAHGDRALAILRAIQTDRLSVIEPPHWLAEVAAVVTRIVPDRAGEIIGLMHAMEFPVLNDLDTYLEATRLARESGQHVFDTLYHAVALRRPGTSLVTADARYYRRARHVGGLRLLEDFVPPMDTV